MGKDLELELTATEVVARIQPRDNNLVLEAIVHSPQHHSLRTGVHETSNKAQVESEPESDLSDSGERSFSALHGPVKKYRRVANWHRLADGRYHYQESVTFWPAMPMVGFMYFWLMRKAFRTGPPSGQHPWWAFPDRLSASQSSVIAVMAIFHVVGGMLIAMLTNTLTFASEDLGSGSAGEQTTVFIAARLGVVITIVVMALADRIGRRRVALWAAGAAAILTVASALAPSLVVLAGLQMLSRNLAIVALLATDTISVEEIPAGSRATAQGVGALAYGLGAGIVILLLPLADIGASGWRFVFAAAAITLPLIAYGSRWLPESERFTEMAAEVSSGAKRQGVRIRRVLILGALFFLVNFWVAPSSQLQNDYLHADRGFSGARISLFIILTAVPGFFGILIGGRWADRRGRKGVLAIGLAAMAIFGGAFFVLSGAGMWVSATLWSTLAALSVPALGVLAPELFPTARRGTARGWLAAIATGGSVVGLLFAGQLVDRFGYGTAFTWIALAPLIAMAVSFAVPETAKAELEDLNEDPTKSPG